MVNVSVDNKVVNVLLNGLGEQVTVPSGEVWKVNVFIENTLILNGGPEKISGNNAHFEQVFSGGDVLRNESGEERYACKIGGFDVS